MNIENILKVRRLYWLKNKIALAPNKFFLSDLDVMVYVDTLVIYKWIYTSQALPLLHHTDCFR